MPKIPVLKPQDLSGLVVVLQHQLAHLPLSKGQYFGTYGIATCVGLYVRPASGVSALAHLDGGSRGYINQTSLFLEHCGLAKPSRGNRAFIITSEDQEMPSAVQEVELMLSICKYSPRSIRKIRIPRSEGIAFDYSARQYRFSPLQYASLKPAENETRHFMGLFENELKCITDGKELGKIFDFII